MGRVVYGSRVSIFKCLFEAKQKLNTAFLLLGINRHAHSTYKQLSRDNETENLQRKSCSPPSQLKSWRRHCLWLPLLSIGLQSRTQQSLDSNSVKKNRWCKWSGQRTLHRGHNRKQLTCLPEKGRGSQSLRDELISHHWIIFSENSLKIKAMVQGVGGSGGGVGGLGFGFGSFWLRDLSMQLCLALLLMS